MTVRANGGYCPCSITNWYFGMEKENVQCDVGADVANCVVMWCLGIAGVA